MQFTAKYEEAFKLTVGHEGGYQNRHSDRGNWTSGKVGVGLNRGTKFGISAMSYPTLDMVNIIDLTLDDAKAIYKRDYWDRVCGDDLPVGLGYAVFDFAVNSGVFKASIELQRLVGASEDGVIGPLTVAQVNRRWLGAEQSGSSSSGVQAYLASYIETRQQFVESLSGFAEYGKGWTRRIEDVHTHAYKMIEEGYE